MTHARLQIVHHSIGQEWQQFWEQNKTFRTPDEAADRRKYYILDMFPYPSGSGLHVGHPEGYTATDILARYRRMCGWNVMHPMGWDAFGLPAEQYAIKTGTHPRITTQQNIDTFRRQIKSLGFSYDWDREIDTTDPNYFKWTQWIFLQIFDTWYDAEQKKGRPISELPIPAEVRAQGQIAVRRYQDTYRLAYQAEVAVNWCPELGTVLANEEVVDGKSEVGGFPVVRRPLRQWLMRITAYADRLLEGLEHVDWAEGIKKLQYDWIGCRRGRRSISAVEICGEKVRLPRRVRTRSSVRPTWSSPRNTHLSSASQRRDSARTVKEISGRGGPQERTRERTEGTKKKTGMSFGAFRD